ncbi:hypothetical protein BOTBODRAFT_181006 [Botryobasidium botryosum FD-172 SS1]|uniref:Endonuclease/exonuclease/phosphatase domain-containing protein n=1 Tax=Botryobasidium botryosum (strain FD-172 SS1) TaxID=930990 RepID=A0A067M696_BOTB1|nr:hypothetical protein BOTBODRAFT_181006 [Botryobasidium botryosum FD-172 SS1]
MSPSGQGLRDSMFNTAHLLVGQANVAHSQDAAISLLSTSPHFHVIFIQEPPWYSTTSGVTIATRPGTSGLLRAMPHYFGTPDLHPQAWRTPSSLGLVPAVFGLSARTLPRYSSQSLSPPVTSCHFLFDSIHFLCLHSLLHTPIRYLLYIYVLPPLESSRVSISSIPSNLVVVQRLLLLREISGPLLATLLLLDSCMVNTRNQHYSTPPHLAQMPTQSSSLPTPTPEQEAENFSTPTTSQTALPPPPSGSSLALSPIEELSSQLSQLRI